MNDRELIYVKTIAEEQSVSAAARKLYIAQPSLSQSLQRIEDGLGTKLFNRTPGGLTLTQAGKKYLLMANRVLKLYDDLKVELIDMDTLNGGSVAFGITPLLGKILLPEVLPEFRKRYPKVNLQIVEANSRELDRMLTACEISFGVMHRLVGWANSHIEYDVFGEDPFVVTVAHDSPLLAHAEQRDGFPYPVIDLKLLASEPLITVHTRQRIRHVTEDIFTRASLRPTIALELRDYTTAQELAAQGMGYTVGPQSYTRLSRSDEFGARYLAIDPSYNPKWCLCLTTFRNSSLSHADEELKGHFARTISSMME